MNSDRTVIHLHDIGSSHDASIHSKSPAIGQHKSKHQNKIIIMKTLQLTAIIATSLFCAGSVLAAGGQGRRGNGNGNGGQAQTEKRGACQADCPNGADGTCNEDCDQVRQGKGKGNGKGKANGRGQGKGKGAGKGQGNGQRARDGSGSGRGKAN